MEIKQHKVQIKHSEIFLDEEGILWLVPDADADIDLEEVKACYDTYEKMGFNKDNKVLQIIDIKGSASLTKEARDFAVANGSKFFLASAVISNNLSVRLIVNFFNLFYKSQPVPFKMFDSEENAKKWLRKFLQ
ncbi:MAG: hypothetical protein H0X46_07120 [Bacteroidetes bacterium]|nr:hypothetical protein [Bacteroidota bacterium]